MDVIVWVRKREFVVSRFIVPDLLVPKSGMPGDDGWFARCWDRLSLYMSEHTWCRNTVHTLII